MAIAPDKRPHLILVTHNTCPHSQRFREIWNQIIENPDVTSNFQCQHLAVDSWFSPILLGQPPINYHDFVQWFPWLMVIKDDIWTAVTIMTQEQFYSRIEVFNGKNSASASTGRKSYPSTYTGILAWLRHCQEADPMGVPAIQLKPSTYLREIHDVAPRFSLSPFWAAAYRDRSLPFAPDTRKVIGSSYLPELARRQQQIRERSIDTERPNLMATEYQTLMQPLLDELRLLGLIDQFNFNVKPSHYGQMIRRHLELLIQGHMV
jgi:hypothetical protein